MQAIEVIQMKYYFALGLVIKVNVVIQPTRVITNACQFSGLLPSPFGYCTFLAEGVGIEPTNR